MSNTNRTSKVHKAQNIAGIDWDDVWPGDIVDTYVGRFKAVTGEKGALEYVLQSAADDVVSEAELKANINLALPVAQEK